MSGGLSAVEGRFGGVRVRERYGLVLILILGGYLLAGFDHNGPVRIANALIWIVLLLAALWSPGIPRRLQRIGAVVTMLLLVAGVALTFSDSDTARSALLLLLGTAQALALLAILARISQHREVSRQTVMGAIAGYALIGFSMAALFHGLELVSDGTFLNNVVATGDYLYFSFVTLTTVGYGDITAASDVAKRLVVVEALLGQIFLITLVARLVTLWGKPLPRGNDG